VDKYKALLKEVIEYAHGEGKYDLRNVRGDQYAAVSYGAWMELESRIIDALADDDSEAGTE
jgi:hypothetical protein